MALEHFTTSRASGRRFLIKKAAVALSLITCPASVSICMASSQWMMHGFSVSLGMELGYCEHGGGESHATEQHCGGEANVPHWR